MMATTYQHPNQMQHSVQQGPQQHIQGHPGQPNAIAMQHMHPQVYQQQLARQSAPHHTLPWLKFPSLESRILTLSTSCRPEPQPPPDAAAAAAGGHPRATTTAAATHEWDGCRRCRGNGRIPGPQWRRSPDAYGPSQRYVCSWRAGRNAGGKYGCVYRQSSVEGHVTSSNAAAVATAAAPAATDPCCPAIYHGYPGGRPRQSARSSHEYAPTRPADADGCPPGPAASRSSGPPSGKRPVCLLISSVL